MMVSYVATLALFFATTAEPANNPAVKKENYAAAYKEAVEEDKPLMVVVGAEWCPACNNLKNSTISPMLKSGELDTVSFVQVDHDQDRALSDRLTRGQRSFPQIIMFSKNGSGQWVRRQLKGFQSKQPVRRLIRNAVGS